MLFVAKATDGCSADGAGDGIELLLQPGDPIQQISEAWHLTAQHPRIGHGLVVRFQGRHAGISWCQLQVAVDRLAVVDGLLIDIPGAPEVLLVLRHLQRKRPLTNGRFRDACTGQTIEVISVP